MSILIVWIFMAIMLAFIPSLNRVLRQIASSLMHSAPLYANVQFLPAISTAAVCLGGSSTTCRHGALILIDIRSHFIWCTGSTASYGLPCAIGYPHWSHHWPLLYLLRSYWWYTNTAFISNALPRPSLLERLGIFQNFSNCNILKTGPMWWPWTKTVSLNTPQINR